MIQKLKSKFKLYLILGVLLAVFLPGVPVLAADSTSAVTATSTSGQASSTGTADNTANGTMTPPVPPVQAPAAANTSAVTTNGTLAPTGPTAPGGLPVTNTGITAATLPTVLPDITPVPNPTLPVLCTPLVKETTPITPSLVQASPTTVTPTTTPMTTNATIDTCLGSAASSGDAGVKNNVIAGNATTGTAAAAATLLNLIASTTGLSGDGLTTFVKNINNQNGDLVIDPAAMAILNVQNPNCGCLTKLQSLLNATINNNIDLNATTGKATVANNGTAGNATTGDANAIANLVNIINSMTNAKQSFLGIINIHGTLNGNIVLPQGWYDSLLADNAGGTGCTTGCSPPAGSTTTINNLGVNNAINLNANSGKALVDNNGSAGNATTGNALTKLNIINLVNRQIVGGNVLLVFINVLGHWVGLLMDAPAGTTSGTLGGAITKDTSVCGCLASGNSTLNAQINNNINLNAISGDASVINNDKAGNATTGNASASLNLVNIINSTISAAHWFGVLFINVFGTWNGSLIEQQPPAAVIVVFVAPVTPVSPKVVKSTIIKSDDHGEAPTSEPETLVKNVLGDSTTTPATVIQQHEGGRFNYLAFAFISGSCYCAFGILGRFRRLFR
jgi:hypothetical protein